MKDIPRLLPIWVGLLLLVIALQQCGCRGGTSLGKGSAGTVIVPQTPQEINERNRQPLPKMVLPPFEPLPPITIIPQKSNPVVPKNAVRSNPIIPESQSAKANPIVSNPKAAGELKPFSPTISSNISQAKLPATEVKLPPKKVINSDNKNTDISLAMNMNAQKSNSQQTNGDGGEASDKVTFNWGKAITWWMMLLAIVIFIWVVFDIVRSMMAKKEKPDKVIPKKKATKKKATKKKAVKKVANKKK